MVGAPVVGVRWPPSLLACGIGPASVVALAPDLPPRGRRVVAGVVEVGAELWRVVLRARGC